MPGSTADNIRDSIDALREQISELEECHTKQSRSEAHRSLLVLAEDTVADGETIYEQSVASGSLAGNSLYANTQQQDMVTAWLQQQTSLKQRAPSLVTGTTESVSSLNWGEERTPIGLTPILQESAKMYSLNQETELELGLACHKVKKLLSDANAQFAATNYCRARMKLKELLPAIRRLPSHLHSDYDFLDIQYKLAVASYHSTEHMNARSVLVDFIRQEASANDQRLQIAHASFLLACVFVETRELEAARSSCANSIQMYRQLADGDSKICDQNLALAARIELLLGNRETAAALTGQITPSQRSVLINHYSRLPHKQCSSIAERKNVVACEDYLFANAGLSEESGRTEMVAVSLPEQQTRSRLSWRKRPRSTGSILRPSEPILTQLHIAALFGDTEWAIALIADGADVNHACTISTSDCRQLRWKRYHDPLMPITPLACALLLRQVDMIRLLVSRGSLLTTWGGSSYAVALLNEAYIADDSYTMDEVLLCLKHLGWNIDSLVDVDCSRSRRTLLHHAASILDTGNVRHLTFCGADVLAQDEQGNIPLSLAMKATGSAVTKTMSILLQYKPQEQLDSRDRHGRTPLHCLVDLDNHMSEDAAWILLRAGANPFLADHSGNTPYKWFLRNRHHWTEIRAICEDYQTRSSKTDQPDPSSASPGSRSHTAQSQSASVSDISLLQHVASNSRIRPTTM